MKTLYLVRHAKSSHEFDLHDHERPLAERGLNDAPLVAAHVKEKIKLPQLVLSSDAVRAKSTAILFLKELGIPENKMILDKRLYDFDGERLDSVIRETNDDVDILMVFGHNNAMTNKVNEYGDQYIDSVSTASFTAIEFDADSWKNIAEGKTKHYIKPKDIK